MPRRKEILVFPVVFDMHFLGRTAGGVGVEAVRLLVLSKGSRFGAERPQTEGAEGREAGETRVRGNVHDRGQGLGGGADIGTNYNWKNFGKQRCYRFAIGDVFNELRVFL